VKGGGRRQGKAFKCQGARAWAPQVLSPLSSGSAGLFWFNTGKAELVHDANSILGSW